MAVMKPWLALPPASPSTVVKSTAPKWKNIRMIAMDRPKSPTRLATNALLAAVA